MTPYFLDNGSRRDGYPGEFTTQAQRINNDRRQTALSSLRGVFGIDVDTRDVDWTIDALEELLNAVGEINTKHEIIKKD